ncbi:MAG: hypothetical protein ACI4LX_07910 [Treponema sp.]
MKKNLKSLNIAFITACMALGLNSCESTQQVSKNNAEETAVVKTEPAEQKKDESFSLIKKQLQNLKITLVSSANIPAAGTAFKIPYVVNVKDKDGKPCPDFSLNVTYPVSKNENAVNFGSAQIVTDENGNASFKPDTISTSMNSTVIFEPALTNNNPQLVQLARQVALEVPCKVKFSIVKQGIVINLVDYSENGKMILNSPLSTSSNLVGEFWRAGYTSAQNADFHTAIDGGSEAVYAAAKNLFQGGSYFKYIIYGKVKYASEITEVEGGYSLSLTGTATVIDYSTGKEYFTTTKTATVIDKNKWNILKACQTQLAKELADELFYSM